MLHDAPIDLHDHHPEWAAWFEREAQRIRQVLGDRAVVLEHTGSTSVPGLAAKPIIDITMGVPDSADEAAYVPAMAAAGYVLRIREPDWFEHRLLKGPDTNINLHVFSAGSPEITRMLAFRDHLRTDEADRKLYERTKRELAARTWTYVQGLRRRQVRGGRRHHEAGDALNAKPDLGAICPDSWRKSRPDGGWRDRRADGGSLATSAQGGKGRALSYAAKPVCSQIGRSVRPCSVDRRPVRREGAFTHR